MDVEIVRKDIKNLHLAVYPPNGRIRIAVPLHLGEEAARLAVIERLPWIRRQRKTFREQDRQSEREMVTGETHYVEGRRYRLDVIEMEGRPSVWLRNSRTLELRVQPGTGRAERAALLHRWYRRRLRAEVADLVAQWAPVIGVEVSDWGIRRMKTRWGTCNTEARRIWLNLELAKKPQTCIEFILVHEMVHLLERHHSDRFRALLHARVAPRPRGVEPRAAGPRGLAILVPARATARCVPPASPLDLRTDAEYPAAAALRRSPEASRRRGGVAAAPSEWIRGPPNGQEAKQSREADHSGRRSPGS